MVLPREQSAVLARGVFMLQLRRNRAAMRFVGVGCLLRRGTCGYSALSAVVRHVRIIVYDDGLVIDIGDVCDIHISHRPVVEKFAAAPFAAGEAFAEVSEAVINAAVESEMRAPIAGIPNIEAVVPTPVSGGPQIAYFRGFDPSAGHPVVAVIVAPGPVPRCPYVARAGAEGLLVNRQRRRTNSHGNAEANLCRRWGRKCGWNNQQQESERQEPHYTLQLHFVFLVPFGLACEGSTRRAICFKTWRRLNPQPAVCPDEGPAYLNTEDWNMLLGKKLFGMRNFRLLASPRVLGWVANRVTPTWRGPTCGDASTRCSAIFEHDTVL